MSKKEEFLAIKTYEEFDRRRAEFEGLKMTDEEVRQHMYEIFPKVSDTKEELYKTLPHEGRTVGR